MALTSTLFTGLSGLDVNQTRLNVVGNNIANVNTVGFKSSRALFKPQFYVTDAAGSPSSSSFGGTNPSQRGLGATLGAIEKDFTPGSIEPTGKPTDLAIDGDGFFIVQSNEQKFTRDGSFTLNSANELVTTGGDFVQGYGVDSNANVIQGALQKLVIPLGTATSAKATENVTLEGNLNAAGSVAGGASILNSQPLTTALGTAPDATTALTDLVNFSDSSPVMSTGDVFTLSGKKAGRDMADRTFTVGAASTVGDLMTFFQDSMGIDPSVPADSTKPTPGGSVVTLSTDDPTTARLTLTGNVGEENSLSLTGTAFTSSTGQIPFSFVDGSDGTFTSDPTGESTHTSFVAYDSLGTPLTVDLTAVLESKSDTGNTWRYFASSGDNTDPNLSLGTGTIQFDNTGKITQPTPSSITLRRDGTGAATPMTVNLDFNSMTSLTSRDSEMVMTEQDGSEIGSLNAYSIGADGTISGSFTNGLTKNLGQLAVATFANNQGLQDKGGNMFTTSANSGVAVVSTPLSLGAGAVRSGSLELSNVDLSKEFINLIISSTGFSASSRVITTSDQLLTELLNSAR